ncbi:hypothetical protein M0Q50_03350 [bacterium]|jgi:hypothetical protein|nr:hypothetical protein [bacterium]
MKVGDTLICKKYKNEKISDNIFICQFTKNKSYKISYVNDEFGEIRMIDDFGKIITFENYIIDYTNKKNITNHTDRYIYDFFLTKEELRNKKLKSL